MVSVRQTKIKDTFEDHGYIPWIAGISRLGWLSINQSDYYKYKQTQTQGWFTMYTSAKDLKSLHEQRSLESPVDALGRADAITRSRLRVSLLKVSPLTVHHQTKLTERVLSTHWVSFVWWSTVSRETPNKTLSLLLAIACTWNMRSRLSLNAACLVHRSDGWHVLDTCSCQGTHQPSAHSTTSQRHCEGSTRWASVGVSGLPHNVHSLESSRNIKLGKSSQSLSMFQLRWA